MNRNLFTAVALLLSTWTALRAAPPAPTQASAAPIKIVLVGDSTVEDQAGWGIGFKKLLGPGATCVNRAKSGRSSRSFMNEGWWKKALAEKPDYVLIQFGHNDQPGKGPERETDPAMTYPQWMLRYVEESRAAGAKPVLITSMARRTFGKDGKIASSLVPYVEALKKLAGEQKVPVIDLHALSIALLEKIGPDAALAFDFVPPPKAGVKPGRDATHLSPAGAEVMGKIVADELKKVTPELGRVIKE